MRSIKVALPLVRANVKLSARPSQERRAAPRYQDWFPLRVQTVNDTPLGTKPEVAAQTIGGLPVSQNMKPTLDVACGPFVLEDGTFDIELI